MAQIVRAEIVGTRMAQEGSGGYTVNSTSYSVLVFYSNGTVSLVEGGISQIKPYLGYMTPNNDMQQLRTILNDFEVKIKNDIKEIFQQELFRLESNRNPVPNIVGKDRQSARKALEDAGFICEEPGNVSKDISAIVNGYNRSPDNPKVIRLKLRYTYPSVIGMSLHAAAETMAKAGFNPLKRNVSTKDQQQYNRVLSVTAGDGLNVILSVGDKDSEILEQIRNDDSMMSIWKKWEEAGLSNRYPRTTNLIKKHKEAERLYGKVGNNIDLKRQEIINMFREES